MPEVDWTAVQNYKNHVQRTLYQQHIEEVRASSPAVEQRSIFASNDLQRAAQPVVFSMKGGFKLGPLSMF